MVVQVACIDESWGVVGQEILAQVTVTMVQVVAIVELVIVMVVPVAAIVVQVVMTIAHLVVGLVVETVIVGSVVTAGPLL